MDLESSQVHAFFPTFVWQTRLAAEARKRIDSQVMSVLDERIPAKLATGHSWQSDHQLHELDAFADLTAAVKHLTRAALRFLRVGTSPSRSPAAGQT